MKHCRRFASWLNAHRTFAALLVLEVCFLCFHFVTGMKVQAPITLSGADLIAKNSTAFLDEDGGLAIKPDTDPETYGTYAVTPQLSLKKGSYRVTVDYKADGDGGKMLQNNELVVCNNVTLNAFRNRTTFTAWANGDTATFFEFTFNGYARAIYSFSVVPTHAYVRTTLVLWLMAFALLDFFLLLWRGLLPVERISPNARLTALALVLMVVAVSLPLGLNYIPGGHDLSYHLARIQGLADGLSAGAFPVKIYPSLLQGNGYANGVFYGDLFLYFPAVLRLIGFSLQNCYKTYVFAVNLGTVLVSYFCCKKIFGSRLAGLLGSLLYAFSIYRLVNLYLRAAVGEYTAMMFLPLIFYGLWHVFSAEPTQKGYQHFWIPITIGYTGLICCHVLSCEIAAIFTVFACLICIKKVFRPATFWVLCKAVIFTVLLSAWFLVPFLEYSTGGDFNVTSTLVNIFTFSQNAAFPSQLFDFWSDFSGVSIVLADGAQNDMSFSAGPALLAVLPAFAAWCITATDKKAGAAHRLCATCIGLALFALFMASSLFPWYDVTQLLPFLAAPIAKLQFPWRFLSAACVFLSGAGVAFFVLLRRRDEKWGRIWLYTLLAMVVLVSGNFLHGTLKTDAARYFDLDDLHPFEFSDYGYAWSQISGAEYLPKAADAEIIWELTEPAAPTSVIWSDFSKSGLTAQITAENTSGGEQQLVIPFLYYKGYHAIDSATGQELALTVDKKAGQVSVVLPAGYSGALTVSFREAWYWRCAEALSLCTLLALCGYALFLHRRATPENTV